MLAQICLACSRLRDGGAKSFSKKKCEKRAGAQMVQFDGEIIKLFSSRSLRAEKEVFFLERKRKFSSWVAAEKICSRHWTKARRALKASLRRSRPTHSSKPFVYKRFRASATQAT